MSSRHSIALTHHHHSNQRSRHHEHGSGSLGSNIQLTSAAIHAPKSQIVTPARSRSSSFASIGCSIFSGFSRKGHSSNASSSAASICSDTTTATDYSTLPSSGRQSQASSRRGVVQTRDLCSNPAPHFECVFWFLDCPYLSYDRDQWKSHCFSHFEGHSPPTSVNCPLCDDFEEFHYDDGTLAWTRKLDHLATQHFLAGHTLRSSGHIGSSLLTFLRDSNIITEKRYEALRDLTKPEYQVPLVGEVRRERNLAHASQSATLPFHRSRVNESDEIEVPLPSSYDSIPSNLEAEYLEVSHKVPWGISRWLSPSESETQTSSESDDVFVPRYGLPNIEEEEEEDDQGSKIDSASKDTKYDGDDDDEDDPKVKTNDLKIHTVKPSDVTAAKSIVDEICTDASRIISVDRLMEAASSLLNTMKISQCGVSGPSGGIGQLPSGHKSDEQQSGNNEHDRSSSHRDRQSNNRQSDRRGSEQGGAGGSEPISEQSDAEGKKLACPYFKHDPQKYQKVRSCPGPGWDTVHRLKEHLYRRHALPIRCRRCFEMFKTEDLLDAHYQAMTPCDLKAPPPLEGFDKSQEKKLKNRKRKAGVDTEEEKWREVYKILFPEADPALIPSPYYECEISAKGTSKAPSGSSQAAKSYQEFLRQDLPRRVRRKLDVSADQELEEKVKARLMEILEDCQEQSYSAFQTFISQTRQDHQRTDSSSPSVNLTVSSFDPPSFDSTTMPLESPSSLEEREIQTSLSASDLTFEEWAAANFIIPASGAADIHTLPDSAYHSGSNRHSLVTDCSFSINEGREGLSMFHHLESFHVAPAETEWPASCMDDLHFNASIDLTEDLAGSPWTGKGKEKAIFQPDSFEPLLDLN